MKKNLTRSDIARLAGVSPSTVSRAMTGSPLLPPSTIEKIRRIADERGYTPNVLAKRFTENRSRQICLVAPLGLSRGIFRISYFSEILDSLVAAAYKRDYSVSIAPFDTGAEDSVERLAEYVASRRADGLILAGFKISDQTPGKLRKAKIPLVLLGSESGDEKTPTVNFKQDKPVTELFQELSARGYRRMFYIHGSHEFHDAVEQHRLVQEHAGKYFADGVRVVRGDYSRRSGYEAAGRILPEIRRGDVVFAANDRMATGLYKMFHEKGVRIPDDVGVAGCDDDESSRAVWPELTTIRQPRSAMGETAANMLMDMLEGKRLKVVSARMPGELKIRNSILRKVS